ncbi:penicillin-binding protein 2 [Hippea alviniae]|uniref:penicillin-binding protein 2 n=1 Tax=Hippea alviniae TaxID=1279027 RepID=UPI0003B77C2C|nr:penicillin-binding protein 2 [Hippea alviniae]
MAKRDKYILNKADIVKKSADYLSLIIAVSFIIIIARLFYLQIIKGNYFLDLSKKNSIRLIGIAPPRGDIKTSDGVLYAKNTPSFSVSIYKTPDLTKKAIEKIAQIISIEPSLIEKKLKLTPYYRSVLIKRDISRNEVFNLLFKGEINRFINIEVTPKRVYPSNAFAYANIVGYLTEVSLDDLKKDPTLKVGELIGRKGIEKKYDKVLRGKWGYKEVQTASNGMVIKTLSETPPKKGKTLTLTINSKLQTYIYELFKEEGLHGAAVVMRPDGAILALVDSDTFNPNYFTERLSKKEWEKLKKKHLLNLFDIATQGAFPPGSLIKPFMALAALKEGIITPNKMIFCPYAVKIGKYIYRDWKPGGFGKINLYRAIESSSDVYFYQVGMKLGINKIDYYLSKFGFGKSPKLFSYCTKGNLPSREWKYRKYKQGWYIGDTISTSIGQGFFLASPLQVALAFSIIANDGIGYKPFLVKDAKREILYIFKSKYYKDIKKALWLVVNGPYGTAYNARIEGLNICGKTGTSQVVKSSVYKKIKKLLKEKKIKPEKAIKYFPHAWFASFAPMNKPQVVVVVFLEHGEYSSKAAAFAGIIYDKLIQLKLILLSHQS